MTKKMVLVKILSNSNREEIKTFAIFKLNLKSSKLEASVKEKR